MKIGTLALLFILIIGAYFGVNQEDTYTGQFEIYTICPGDTIWSIAEDIEGDTEKIVYLIRKDNNIQDCGNLQIGQQILLREEY